MRHLAPLEGPPAELERLFQDHGGAGRHFRDNARHYNGAFSFVSYGSDCFEQIYGGGRSPPVMQVHGTTYHMASRLFPDDPENGLYAQVYLYDHSTALKRRTSTTLRLRDYIVADLQNMMDRESPYVQLYRHMRDIVQEHRAPDAYLGFAAARDEDMRRYNHPQQLEQAIVFVGKEGEPPINRDIVLWPHEFAAHRISELSEHLDPLAYPLLFPRGELGWHPALRHDARHRTDKYNRITPIQFFAHRLMVRRDDQGQGPRRSILPHCVVMLF